MKIKTYFLIASVLGFIFFVAVSFGAQPENQPVVKSPSAYLPAASYEFAAVVDGQYVTHDFVIQNKGTELLQVQKVKTD